MSPMNGESRGQAPTAQALRQSLQMSCQLLGINMGVCVSFQGQALSPNLGRQLNKMGLCPPAAHCQPVTSHG